MKNIFLGIFLLYVFANNLYAKEYNFVKSGKKPTDFIDNKHKLISAKYGDLNSDKRKDMVLLIEKIHPINIRQGDGYESSQTFNYNPRTILVMFQDSQGIYHLEPSSVNNQFIPPEDDEENTNFIVESDFEIDNNKLFISFQTMMGSGGWGATSSTFRFRYQNNKFVLIGQDVLEWARNTGIGSSDSYNYLANIHKHTENLDVIDVDENKGLKSKTTTRKISFKRKKLIPLSEMKYFTKYY